MIYNTLTQIEATFRTLKTDLAIRPVHHQKDQNTEAHIFLGVLAYQVVATIRHQLKVSIRPTPYCEWFPEYLKLQDEKGKQRSVLFPVL
jgi:transposase